MSETLGEMRRASALEHALRHAPGQLPVEKIVRTPITFRRIEGHALAHTAEHVLVEWTKYGQWYCRWEPVQFVTRR